MKKQLFIIVNKEEQLSAIKDLLSKYPNLDFDINIFLAFKSNSLDQYGIAFPRMDRLQPFTTQSAHGKFFLRTLEQLGGITELLSNSKNDESAILAIDNSIPIWNKYSYSALFETVKINPYFVASYEFTIHEIEELYKSLPDIIKSKMILPIYGFIPLMISAGCIKETQKICDKKDGLSFITDRKGISFPVVNDCNSCTNIIYNSLPYSGHELILKESLFPQASYKLEFTIENSLNTTDILAYYLELLENRHEKRPAFEYTTGHLKRKTL